MLQIIIFSFNRASQLEALLNSLISFWKSPEYIVDIVYNYSTPDFGKGYDILKDKMKGLDSIKFHKEESKRSCYSFMNILNIHNFYQMIKYPAIRSPKTNFRDIVLKLVEVCKCQDIMFLTDDSVFIKDVNLPAHITEWIERNPFQNQFSLRLGLGMNNQPKNINKVDSILNWNTYEVDANKNWGYHFSVDAHIYSKELIRYYFKKYTFSSPNTLEGYICSRIRSDKNLKYAKAFKDTSILSFPLNIVQNFTANEHMGLSTEYINSMYLKGYVIQYPIPSEFDMFQQYPSQVQFISKDDCITYKTR